jgi:hypothetical protein
MRTTLQLFSADYDDGQIERTLAAAYADAADIGEVLAVARRISPRVRFAAQPLRRPSGQA